MSTIEDGLQYLVVTEAVMSGELADRVFPVLGVPHELELADGPYATFQRIGSTRTHTHEGDPKVATAMIQYDVYARDYPTVRRLAQNIRRALTVINREVHVGSRVHKIASCFVESERDAGEMPIDGSDWPTYRVSLDFTVQHTELTT